MADEVGIVMKLYDEVSPTLKSITGSSKAFDKTMDDLEKGLKAYDKAQTTLTEKMSGLKKALAENSVKVKEAQKAYKKLKDETSKGALDDAIDEQTRLRREMEETRAVIDANATAYKNLYKEVTSAASAESRLSNRAGDGSTGILSALGKAGLGQMAGDAIMEISNTMIGSALGSDGGSLISSALSSAVSGAAMGSLAGPAGTAIGAAVGGALGLATGGAQIFASQDEAFKSYYADLYQSGQDRAAESLTAGSATASQRELDAIAFNRLLGSGVGDKYLSDLRVLAADTPMEYSDLTAMSRALATGFGDSPERMLELMTAIGDAGSAVGVDASGMTYMAQILSRVQSSNQFSKEDLDAFQDRGINVLSMLSSSFGVAEGEIYDMISKGEINGRDAVDIIQQGMETAYSGAMELMAETFSGLTSTLEDTMAELDNARGEGYNQERSAGLQAEIDAYGGPLGDAIQNLNRISGENEGYMKNLSEQYTREALSAVLLGEDATLFPEEQQAELRRMREDFLAASSAYEDGNEEAGLKMESLRQQAEAMATAAYESSDQYSLLYDSEQDMIGAIRDNTAALEGWKNDYRLEQEKSKGQGDVWMENLMLGDRDDPSDGLSERVQAGLQADQDRLMAGINGSHAYGLDRVPRNGLYYLHQDERVLTAQAAGEQSRKSGTTFQITIKDNHFGADMSVEAVAQTLADLLERKIAAGVIG